MSKKIAIIGSGADKEWLSAQLASKGLNDVLIVTPDEAKEIVKAEDRFTKYPDLMIPAEKAIHEAVEAVEEIGAHPLLTDAINLLSEAANKVADFIEKEE